MGIRLDIDMPKAHYGYNVDIQISYIDLSFCQ